MKIVLYCAKFMLNEAIDNTKAKVDTKLMELVLKCTKSKLNQAVSKSVAKAGNLELNINVQSACQDELGRVTRKLPKLETKWFFFSWKAKMLSNDSSKISNFPCLFLGKKRMICE
jgi:hypothetical protein